LFILVLGHDSEIQQCIQILIEERKNNFFLIEDSVIILPEFFSFINKQYLYLNSVLQKQLFLVV
jgi:hypothetical protein